MPANQSTYIVDEFRRGFRLQTNWSWSMASAFFCGELGAGLFLVALFYHYLPGMLAGLLITAVGKTTGHLLHLGQPLRSWRAIVKINRSWVSRGLLAIILFVGFGLAYILCLANLTFGVIPTAIAPLYAGIATAAAVVVMLYQGLAMSHSAAIAFWSSGLMPVMGITYGLLGGVSLLLAFGQDSLLAGAPQSLENLKAVELGLLLYAFINVASLLHAARYSSKGGQESAAILTQGHLSSWFASLVLFVGMIVPSLLIAFGGNSQANSLGVSAAILTGYYALRVLILKAGVYDPIQSFKPRPTRY